MITFFFNPPYYLAGQSGKALGLTPVSFEDAGVVTARLVFKNQATDELTMFIITDVPPDWEQQVSLYDSAGTRVFTGLVSLVDPEWDEGGLAGWHVTVSGPWWWLEQAQITLLTCQENTGWHYVAPPASAVTVPTPAINAANPAAVTIAIPTSPFITQTPILSAANCTLHYTIDGTAPTTASPVYSAPIAAAAGMVIKAMGTKSGGYANSSVASASFTNRPTFTVPSQDLALSIGQLMARMAAMGVPLGFGSMSSSFGFLQLCWQGSTGADMLRDILDAVPDAMTWINYGAGTPALSVIRRPEAAAVTLALGTDADLTGGIALKARRELRPSYVEVQGMTVDAQGNITLTSDAVGNPNLGILGNQYLSVAGPGNRAFSQQAAALEKVALVTYPLGTGLNLTTLCYAFEEHLKALRLAYSDQAYQYMQNTTSWASGGSSSGWTQNWINPYFAATIDGIGPVSANLMAGWHAVDKTQGDAVPAWWEETGYARKHFKIVVRFAAAFSLQTEEYFKCLQLAMMTAEVVGATWMFADLTIEFDAVNLDCSARTGIVRPCDRFLVTPIPNLASNLYNAQNWLSYDGHVTLHPGSVLPRPGSVINITGGDSGWAAMGALVSALDINLENGSADMTLGSPPRITANALLDKFQRATAGRIIHL